MVSQLRPHLRTEPDPRFRRHRRAAWRQRLVEAERGITHGFRGDSTLFGYLFVWSKNIWVPVTVHFFNNGLAVLMYYFMKGSDLYDKADKIGSDFASLPTVLFSILIVGTLLYYFFKISQTGTSMVDSQSED